VSRVVLASRGSKLALAQTNMVKTLLEAADPGLQTSIEIIHTKGDKILDVPLAQVGGKGLFVKEIEDALLERRADVAVHSLKDVPAELPEGLLLGATLPREVPYDALVSERYGTLDDLPEGAKVGTSSLRRLAQLKALRPDLDVVSLRGNVDTRLRKLSEGLDAILLAAAGLRRLGLGDRVRQLLTPPEFVPAVGQGVVVVECRGDDRPVRELLARLDDATTAVAVRAERAFLGRMGGGCQVPLGAYCQVEESAVVVVGMVGRPDGSTVLRDRVEGEAERAADLGVALAERLLAAGGDAILRELEPL
jgi:hydroxymethylbilane synthase